jgi:pyridoxine kinase
MGRVLAISSQTVFGPVGNSVVVPALQELGHEVLALPTVVLSNHPGHGKPVGQATDIPAQLKALNAIQAFDGLAGVLTGYFSSEAQVIAVAEQVTALRKQNEQLHVLVDPVIGDHGALYVPEAVAKAIRDHLLPLATITTPNRFELTWLANTDDEDAAIAKLAVPETMVTSIPVNDQTLRTRLVVAGESAVHDMPKHTHVPNGTGDFLAGQYLAHRLHHAPTQAFTAAMTRLTDVITASAGQRALQLASKRTSSTASRSPLSKGRGDRVVASPLEKLSRHATDEVP